MLLLKGCYLRKIFFTKLWCIPCVVFRFWKVMESSCLLSVDAGAARSVSLWSTLGSHVIALGWPLAGLILELDPAWSGKTYRKRSQTIIHGLQFGEVRAHKLRIVLTALNGQRGGSQGASIHGHETEFTFQLWWKSWVTSKPTYFLPCYLSTP